MEDVWSYVDAPSMPRESAVFVPRCTSVYDRESDVPHSFSLNNNCKKASVGEKNPT